MRAGALVRRVRSPSRRRLRRPAVLIAERRARVRLPVAIEAHERRLARPRSDRESARDVGADLVHRRVVVPGDGEVRDDLCKRAVVRRVLREGLGERIRELAERPVGLRRDVEDRRRALAARNSPNRASVKSKAGRAPTISATVRT